MAYKTQRASFNSSGGIDGIDFMDCGLIPVYKTTLSASQTIAADEAAHMFGPITIPSGITLTVNGALFVDSRGYVNL
jgi:hypothetical protein